VRSRRQYSCFRGLALLWPVLLWAGCGDSTTAALVTISAEPGLSADTVVIATVGRDGTGAPYDAGTQTFPAGAWPQTLAVLAGARVAAGVDVSVVAFAGGVEVGRGGAAIDFRAGGTVAAEVVLRAACRGVTCEGRAFCGAAGACTPAARRLGFAVNAAGAADQTNPAVSVLGDAGFAVTWVDAAQSPPQLRMRRFDPAGVPRDASDLPVTPADAEQRFPAIAAAPAGDRIVVAWSETGGAVRLRRFDATGAPLADAEEATPGVAVEQTAPALAPSARGFLLAWQDPRPPAGTGSSVMFRRALWQGGWIEAADYVGQPPTAGELAPAVAGACGAPETSLVAWQDTSDGATQIRARWLAGSPPAAGQEAPISGTSAGDKVSPAAATGAAGSAVVWDDLGAAAGTHTIHLRRCQASGALLTADVEVDTVAGARAARPAVGLAGEVALVVWEADAGGAAVILGRRLDAAGPLDAASFLVAAGGAGTQALPRVAGAPDGFLVVWQEHGADGPAGGWGIRARFVGVHDAP
jgi:hypothetical protein